MTQKVIREPFKDLASIENLNPLQTVYLRKHGLAEDGLSQHPKVGLAELKCIHGLLQSRVVIASEPIPIEQRRALEPLRCDTDTSLDYGARAESL